MAMRSAPLDEVQTDPALHIRSVRQQTLAALRWLAIVGQSAAVAASELWLELALPLVSCALCIGVSIVVNIAARVWPARERRLTERQALLTLLYDLAQLATLLYLTGGLGNPFSLFLLAPVTIAATVLTLRTAALLGAFSVAAATLLAFQHLPLRFSDGRELIAPPLLILGEWVAIALGVSFQAAFARRVSMEAFEMSAALTATQMALEREQRLSSIGALAAAAAHELGTPLATIKLVARELKRELGDKPELAEDAELITEQATRCRDILERLSVAQAPEDEQIKTAPIVAVVEEAAGPHRYRRSAVLVSLDGEAVEDNEAPRAQPIISRRPEIIQGLRNLVQNAVDFAASTVWIDIETRGDAISVSIGDDGLGFAPEVLARLGEPFAAARGRGRSRRDDAYEGMGLGVFIAKTLLERTGATLRFVNARRGVDGAPEDRPTGALAIVAWPRGRLVADPAARRQEDALSAEQSAL